METMLKVHALRTENETQTKYRIKVQAGLYKDTGLASKMLWIYFLYGVLIFTEEI
jgi:hypothetical protein